jgi:hypothetical protein
MAFVPAPNIIQVEARAISDGQHVENRFMCHSPTTVDAAKLEDVAVAVWDWWENNYAGVLCSSVLLTEVVATDMSEQNGEQFTYAPDTTTVGTFGGAPLPNEVSLCISLRTSFRGRSARGRYYQLCVGEEGRGGTNIVSTTYAAASVAAGQALITALLGIAPLTIVSYISNKVPRPGGPVYFDVDQAVLVDNVLDSMRSRKPGVGT